MKNDKHTQKESQILLKNKIGNICGADLADMQLIIIFNKGYRFLLCVIDIYSKYEWDVLLKDKKGITITKAFQKVLDESNCKLNKI